jgi:hypothetical protein
MFEKFVLGGPVDLDPDPLERLHLLCHQLLHRLQLRRVGIPGKISCTLVQNPADRRKFGANCSFWIIIEFARNDFAFRQKIQKRKIALSNQKRKQVHGTVLSCCVLI